MKLNHIITAAAVFGCASIGFAANPVTVNSAGGADFTSIQDAISSWAVGGANAGETAPFVINVQAGSGPYDEGITLDELAIGYGNIVGDIFIQSSVPGQPVVLKLQTHPAAVLDTNDGLIISQMTHDVTFRDFIITRSLTNTPIDELVRQDESAPNVDMNTIAFYNCVFTEVGEDGEPLATNKEEALLPPPATIGGPARTANSRLLQHWGDAGESIILILDNCVFYRGENINVLAVSDGAGPESVEINNCLSTYSGYDAFHVGGNNPASQLFITGTDVTAGPLNCTAGLWPRVGGHCLSIQYTVLGQESNISNFLGDSSVAPSTSLSRGISGGTGKMTLANVIVNSQNYGVVDITHQESTWDNVTINTPAAAYFAGGTVAAGGTLTVTDSIISGAGTKFAGLIPTGGVTVRNSGLPTSGPHAIGATGTITEENNIYDDPEYVATDGSLETFMDVASDAYAEAASDGGPLSGGADYVGATSDVGEWTLY